MISLPILPFSKDALSPYISESTINFHYGKHHQTYVDNLNKLIVDTELANKSLGEIIVLAAKEPAMAGIFNNAAQVWNHSFYWNCIKPNGGGIASGTVGIMIGNTWGSFEKFAEEFKNAGLTQFGSGWAWLVKNGNTLKIVKTANADTPIAHGLKPLLTVDVWEHAYYLDYQNKRGEYLNTFVEKLINWEFVNTQIG